uniref:Uncharacterized protein n=1 Tax=Glossina brevipalpis TaxID=37001 RepID=A0A1A9WF97_9MUSC
MPKSINPRKLKLQWKHIRMMNKYNETFNNVNNNCNNNNNNNYKKDDRQAMDIPTTDPGSDLIFSTDDEFIFESGNTICRDTLPRMRRNLLQSELQRRYIEEIGDGLRTMPPELIITSPSSPLSIRYKMENSSSRITKVVLPNIERGRHANSNHSLPENESYKSHHHPFHVLSTKRTELNPEDLNIALQIKKKIWAGIQPDSGLLMVDRTKSLGRESTSTKLESKPKSSNILKGNSGDNALSNVPLTANLPPDTKEFLAACSRKLIAWKSANPTQERDANSFTKSKMPLESVVPTIDEKRTMCIFRQLVNSKGLKKLEPSKTESPYETKEGKFQNKATVKKSSITKAVGHTKSKTRSSLRSPPSQQLSQKTSQKSSQTS